MVNGPAGTRAAIAATQAFASGPPQPGPGRPAPLTPGRPSPWLPACCPAGAAPGSPPRSCPCPRPAGSSRRLGASSRRQPHGGLPQRPAAPAATRGRPPGSAAAAAIEMPSALRGHRERGAQSGPPCVSMVRALRRHLGSGRSGHVRSGQGA